MDLNPAVPKHSDPYVRFLRPGLFDALGSCRGTGSLNVVFTSNFFEHLPDKAAFNRTFDQILRCPKRPGEESSPWGRSIKEVPGNAGTFWDHHLSLTEASLSEGLNANHGFDIVECFQDFCSYDGKPTRIPGFFWLVCMRLPIA